MSKESKMMRKELRRFTKGRVDELNPKDVVRAFIDEAMHQSLWQRLKLGLGLIVKWRKLLPIQIQTVNEKRKEKSLSPIVIADMGMEAKQ